AFLSSPAVMLTAEGTSTLIIRALISALMISVTPSVPPVSVH
ncbi:unnamed protein product, partial [Staurois parvus]